MNVKANVVDTKVWTGKVRASYVHVFQPYAGADGTNSKYSMQLLIPKEEELTIKAIKKAMENAAEKGKSTVFGGKALTASKICSVLHDGDEERDSEEYKGMMYISASSKNRKPQVIDTHGNDIVDPDEFYSGCYCRCTLNFGAYSVNGNKGVACYLNNIQKLEDGEPLGGTPASASSDFDCEESDNSWME